MSREPRDLPVPADAAEPASAGAPAAPPPAPAPETPVRLKTTADAAWPEDERLFYLVAREGLFICRNTELFQSCVEADRGPSGLASQTPFLVPRFPRLPRALVEQAVGFFSLIADLHRSEAAAFLVWDRGEQCVRLLVPEQTATVGRAWTGDPYPIGVHYVPPAELPPDWLVFGDIHSHVHLSAYASSVDAEDELHSAGLHIVVGHLQLEPPDFHVEAVVDGVRFRMQPEEVMEGYRARSREIPPEWVARVQVEAVAGYGSVVSIRPRHGVPSAGPGSKGSGSEGRA